MTGPEQCPICGKWEKGGGCEHTNEEKYIPRQQRYVEEKRVALDREIDEFIANGGMRAAAPIDANDGQECLIPSEWVWAGVTIVLIVAGIVYVLHGVST